MLKLTILATLLAVGFGAYYENSANYWVPKINEHVQRNWKAGTNPYLSGKSKQDLKALLGTILDSSKTETAPRRSFPSFKTLPKTFVAGKDKWHKCASTINFIKDQSNCGSCWAIAASEVIADRICIANYASVAKSNIDQTKPAIDMSVEEILTCCKWCGWGCAGGHPIQAMNFWAWSGVVTGGWYGSKCGCQPYKIKPCVGKACKPHPFLKCSHECREGYDTEYHDDKHFAETYYALPANDSVKIQQEIYENGPIECDFAVYSNFFHYVSGVYDHTEGGIMGGHAIKVIGWGEENGVPYWLINNSWNTTWGMHGQVKFLRGKNLAEIEQRCVAGLPKTKDANFLLKCSQ